MRAETPQSPPGSAKLGITPAVGGRRFTPGPAPPFSPDGGTVRSDLGTPPQGLARRNSNTSAVSTARRRPGSSGVESLMTSSSFEMPLEQEACAAMHHFTIDEEAARAFDDGDGAAVASHSPAAANTSLTTPPASRGRFPPSHSPWHLAGAGMVPMAVAALHGDDDPFPQPSTPQRSGHDASYPGRRVVQSASRNSQLSAGSASTEVLVPEEPVPAAPALSAGTRAGMLMAGSGATAAEAAHAGTASRREADVDFATAYRGAVVAHRARRAGDSDGDDLADDAGRPRRALGF